MCEINVDTTKYYQEPLINSKDLMQEIAILRLTFARRNPGTWGFFLCTAGHCKMAARIKYI